MGTDNATDTNTTTGINFSNVTAQTNNIFNAITFGTGLTNLITSPSINISGAGAITGATGVATTTLSTTSTVTFANLSTTSGSSICVDGSNNLIKCTGIVKATLQSAYDLGNTITTSDNRDISFILADTTTDSKFLITNQATASAMVINDTNAATNTLIALQTNGTTNIAFDENGVIKLAGNNTQDITTLTEGNDLTIQPLTTTSASGIGSNLVLTGADESGTTAATGGAVLISGGSATGGSGTRIGGDVYIDGGIGATANGIVNIGTINTNYIALGGTGVSTMLPALSSSSGTSLCRDSVTGFIVACTAGSSSATLQSAYDQGNIIATTDDRNIIFTLSNTDTDSYFSIENQGTAAALVINDTNAATNNLIEIKSNGSSKMTINELGAITTSGNIVATGSATITSYGGLTVLSGGASITGGIDNNSGGISNTGSITGVTDITASGSATLSGASPLILSNNNPVITLATAGNNGVLTIRDAEGSPNTLLTLTDNGTTGYSKCNRSTKCRYIYSNRRYQQNRLIRKSS